MKILMLTDFYPPIIGGMERHVQSLSEALAKRGHKVTVCTIKIGHSSDFEEQNGVRIVRLEGIFDRIPFLFRNPKKKYHPPVQDWLITRNIGDLIEEIKPDVIHGHSWILYSFLPLKKKYDTPLVVTLHDYSFICPKKSITKMEKNEICHKPFGINCISCGLDQYNIIKSFFAYLGNSSCRHLLKHVDKFIAVSQYVKQTYLRYLPLSEKKIVVIPNFYKIEEDFEKRRSVTLPEEFILFVGVLSPLKGIDVLIKAYNTIKTETKLVLIGSEHADYSYTSSRNVIVMKNVPHEAVMKAFARCKFLAIPRISPEACPTVAMEAMNFKKAIIASNVGGLREMVIDGKNGILVSPGDVQGLARAMRFLLNNPMKAKEMGEEGYNLVTKHFSLNSVLPEIERLYEELRNPG